MVMSPKQNTFQKGFRIKTSGDTSEVLQSFLLKASFVLPLGVTIVSFGPPALSAESQAGFMGNSLSHKLLRKTSVSGI